ncbi:MAG: hypothetical protein CUN55_07400 [Phototrophicales bacterium]|nr:MAG: hypothetical protein CUN55_07400 [Phototrophicales bacterium]
MKKKFLIFVTMLVLTSVFVVPAAANQSASDVPTAIAQSSERTQCSEENIAALEGKQFIFNVVGDLSGPYAFISQPLRAGLEDAAAYFNEQEGGICGAEIVINPRDTGGSQDVMREAWDEITNADTPPEMMFLFGSADAELVREDAINQQIPILLSAGSELALYGENGDAPAYTFAIIPLYTDQLGAFCQYISENWESFGIEGDPVIGHLSWEGAFGRSTDTPETRAYCESLGVGYAGAEYFLPTTSDVSTQVDTLVESGANIIFTTSLASGPANIAAAIAGLELQGQVLLAGVNWVLDTSVIGLGGADTQGITGVLPYLWWDNLDNPGIQVVNNSWAVNRFLPAGDDPDAQRAALAQRNIAYLLSFPVIDAYIEVMTRTINRVGAENLNGQAVYETLNEFQYDAMNGILRFSYSDTVRAVQVTQIGQIQFVQTDAGVNPTIVSLTDWFATPDLKAGGADVPAMEE